jgi:hypothetical protein
MWLVGLTPEQQQAGRSGKKLRGQLHEIEFLGFERPLWLLNGDWTMKGKSGRKKESSHEVITPCRLLNREKIVGHSEAWLLVISSCEK